MKFKPTSLIVLIVLALVFPIGLSAQDWPQFRGPAGNGVLEKLEHPDGVGQRKKYCLECRLAGWRIVIPDHSG